MSYSKSSNRERERVIQNPARESESEMEGGMRDVAMMIHKGEFDAVVTLLETREIHAEENREKNLKVWPYAAQMVAHMIQGDMYGHKRAREAE